MKYSKIKKGLLLMSLTTALQAEISWVQPPKQIQLESMAIEKSAMMNTEQQAVSYNQSLLGQHDISGQNDGFVTESKQYWLDAKGAELSQGVNLALTSATAIIRINPLDSSMQKNAIEPNQLALTFSGKEIVPELFVNATQLKAAGMPVNDETVAFKVNAQPGELTVKLSGISNPSDAYVIHVFEPESDHVLSLTTNKQRYNSGSDIMVKANLKHVNEHKDMQVSGYISTPKGEKFTDLKFTLTNDGSYQALLPALKGKPMTHGLWEVHTVTEAQVDGLKVMRDASTAFAVNMATARFSGELLMTEKQLGIGVESTMPSRYEVRGVLYGMDDLGEQQPIALMMAAKWLDQGQSMIQFDVPLDLIEQSGYQGPYQIKQLELKNQSLMTPVQMVESGIRLIALPEIDINRLK
jgi:hypothetical protein